MNDVNLYQLSGVWAAAFSLNFLLAIVQDVGRRTIQMVMARHDKLIAKYPNVEKPDDYYELQSARDGVSKSVKRGSFALYSIVVLVCALSLALIIYSSYFQEAKIGWFSSLTLICAFFVVPPLFLIIFSFQLRRKTMKYELLRGKYAQFMERIGAHKEGTISIKRYASETFGDIRFRIGGSRVFDAIWNWFIGGESVDVDQEMLSALQRLNLSTGLAYEDIISRALAFTHMILKVGEEDPDRLFVIKYPDGSESKIPFGELAERIKRGESPFREELAAEPHRKA